MLCNFGYARGICGRFPADAPFDAARFSILRGNTPGIAQILYVLERAHAPAKHGTITYYTKEDRIEGTEGSEVLEAQARAYLAAIGRIDPATICLDI